MLVIGPTGTGKSVHINQAIALEQKYGGFTFIFDIGGSYESVVELYGARLTASARTVHGSIRLLLSRPRPMSSSCIRS
jgi:hypothetical protein